MAERKKVENPDLDLTPIMNLVTILIPTLLMAAQFVHLAVIDSTLPAIGQPSVEQPDPNETPPLNLQLFITAGGLTLMGTGADEILFPDGKPTLQPGEAMPPTIPCKSGAVCTGVEDYDWKALTKKLGVLKDRFPKEQNVILVPDNAIRYELIVSAMDAARADVEVKDENNKSRELFPYVVIAGGAP